MRMRIGASLLSVGVLLCAPAWANPRAAENLDFRLSIEAISWTSSGVMVKTQLENRTGSPDLFLHHAADLEDPDSFTYTPTASPRPGGVRDTFTLMGMKTSRTSASLVFGLRPGEEPGLLVAGELKPPYRQVAIALKPLLPPRPPGKPAPALLDPADRQAPAFIEPANQKAPAFIEPPSRKVIEAPARRDSEENEEAGERVPGVIQQFVPPHASFGSLIRLMEGKEGPGGFGWARIYTELPDISLAELKRVVEQPAQIWQGPGGLLFLKNVGGRRALAVEVSGESVIAARYVTPETLGQVLGPRTRYPKRVFMGRP